MQDENYLDSLARRVELGQIDFDQWALPQEEKNRILPASNWTEDIVDYFHGEKEVHTLLPWPKTHNQIQLRPNELSLWAAANGHGKSLLNGFVMLGAIGQGKKVCIASMEMPPVTTLARMVRQAVGGESPNRDWIEKFTRVVSDNLRIYSQVGTVKPKTMLGVCRYAREELKVDHMVIDSLMKCGINSDDYNKQKWFVDELATIAKDTGLHIHLIVHSRKKDTEHSKIDKYDIKGASEISDMADNVFTVWRNKKKEANEQKKEPEQDIRDQPCAALGCVKQRNGEWEGSAGLWFNPKSMQYYENSLRKRIDLIGIDR